MADISKCLDAGDTGAEGYDTLDLVFEHINEELKEINIEELLE